MAFVIKEYLGYDVDNKTTKDNKIVKKDKTIKKNAKKNTNKITKGY